MRKLFTLLALLFSHSALCAAFSDSPEALVRQFIADYQQWSDQANARQPLDAPLQSLDLAQQEYAQLLAKFCPPGFQGQSIAFSDPANHGTGYEQILSSSRSADRALVKTRVIKPGTDFAADYHYHLLFSDRRWYLSEVFYIDDEGQYPSL
ncbi:hypothetical protein [Pseudomonas protegens]|uniref:hypothetical protein n=1 Tax=Pseudomonas protegens TaxID=380021 RepID=UPI001B30169E|nr:hypothetical protein [Pseudomonas protegens]MBP5099613.1 hypothetical protein [Pseudomonas protegens]QTU08052.1 hypothetical protein HUT25_20645 [Pseudomonas protegens]QTU14361.1 hypothetical protein HUT23_21335 [Pseudomonas protegens]QTU38258.1 hypothetical protein HUT24_10970 [Pseudomonas protegens]